MRKNLGRITVASLIGAVAFIAMDSYATHAGESVNIPRAAPELSARQWLNSPPIKIADLRGRVVLVEFWTLGCWNCRNVEPYVKQWYRRYHDNGLQVIGVHTPEFDYEKQATALRAYIDEHAIDYAIAVDNEFANWNAFNNRYWPTLYLIDKRGVIRYVKIGEGSYAATERQLQTLLRE